MMTSACLSSIASGFSTSADERFIPPDDFDLDEYMQDAFGVIRTDAEKVVIKFDPLLEQYMMENLWHPSQMIKKHRDGSILMTMEVGGLREVMGWMPWFRETGRGS